MNTIQIPDPVIYDSLGWPEKRQLREEYVQAQNGSCCHCKGSLYESPPEVIRKVKINWRRFPKNFLKYPVHLHHSHKTGLTIGAVHALCNAVLWQCHGE